MATIAMVAKCAIFETPEAKSRRAFPLSGERHTGQLLQRNPKNPASTQEMKLPGSAYNDDFESVPLGRPSPEVALIPRFLEIA